MRRKDVKQLLSLAADSEEMFTFNDSLSIMLQEQSKKFAEECLSDVELSFAAGGTKNPAEQKKSTEINTKINGK